MKLTPWFPGSVKPVREGVYQQMDGWGSLLGYQYWDGSYWHLWGPSIDSAVLMYRNAHPSVCQDDKWRGLSEKPK